MKKYLGHCFNRTDNSLQEQNKVLFPLGSHFSLHFLPAGSYLLQTRILCFLESGKKLWPFLCPVHLQCVPEKLIDQTTIVCLTIKIIYDDERYETPILSCIGVDTIVNCLS